MISFLIKEGLIYDGTGSEPFEGDIGIAGETIAFVRRKKGFNKEPDPAEKIIDARNLAVAPGFIDTHAHSDFTIVADPRAEGKICQGITTEVNGNCGLSGAPLTGEALERRGEDLRELDVKERWSNLKEYFEILKKQGIAPNFATLVGHGNLRACVVGYENRSPDSGEIAGMKELLREAISEGAIGLSTGLIYPPGIYSKTIELIDLCSFMRRIFQSSHPARGSPLSGEAGKEKLPVKNETGIYASHIRSEGERLIEALKEALKIGEESGINIHISHIKTSGEKNWNKIDSAISIMEQARKRNVRVTCDRYPYTEASTDLDTVLPPWVFEGGTIKEIERLKNPETRDRIRREIRNDSRGKGPWEKIFISTVQSERNRWMEGKKVAEIAHLRDVNPIDLVFDLLIQERLRVTAIFSSMNEENLKRLLKLPYVMVGTDSAARCTDGLTCKGRPHPRGFGSFPRFLGRYVRTENLMSFSEAIRKITLLPAETFGIARRGIIQEGAFADVVVFDHKRVVDEATFEEPFLKPKGIYFVFINGVPVLWEGEMTDNKPGRILRHGL
ncbi:MAG: D-aminoacylase [Nitrospirota bacterium]